MKRFIILVFALVLGVGAYAQPRGEKRDDGRPPFSPEVFKKHMTDFITAEAKLTPTEASAFFPVFCEFKDKQRDIMQKVMRLKNPKKEKEITNYEQAVTQIAALEAQAASLEKTYYKRLCKAVPAKKVYKAILAEDRFHRQMLEKFNQGHGPKGPLDGPMGGPGPKGPRPGKFKK